MVKVLLAAMVGFLILVATGCSPIRHQEEREEPPAPPNEAAAAIRHLVAAPTEVGTDHTYGGVPGWYLVSAPRGVEAVAYGARAVWRWDPSSSSYVEFHYLEPSRGYWAKLPARHRVRADADGPTQEEIFEPLGVGWNMISVERVTPRSELHFKDSAGVVKSYAGAVAANWVRPVIWGYQASEGNRYHGVEILNPWYGYFIWAGRNLVFLGGGGAPPRPDPDPVPPFHPTPVGRITALEARRLAAVGVDVGILNVSTLEYFEIYSRKVVQGWVAEHRQSNPPPAWPDQASTYEEGFSLWVRQRHPNAAVGVAVLWPPQAAISHGYAPGKARPWAYVILSGPQGLERWLLCIRRGFAFRWSEILGGSWVKM